MKLIGDHGPERVMRGLASERASQPGTFDGIHLFCFGGFLRTCEWLQRVSVGHFKLDEQGGFDV